MYDTSSALVRSLVIWDHTVLPATRQRWFSGLYPSMFLVLIYRRWKDERLSRPRWLVIPRWFTRPQIVTHASINWARHRVTTSRETNALPQSYQSNVDTEHMTILHTADRSLMVQLTPCHKCHKTVHTDHS